MNSARHYAKYQVYFFLYLAVVCELLIIIVERDDAVDDFYDSIFRTLLTHMMENPHNIGHATHLLFVAKNLERVGDHATNIAEQVLYMKGEGTRG